jgi:hypothetical protein
LEHNSATSTSLFKFGNALTESKGKIMIQIPVPGPEKHIKILVDVVDMDIPLLLGLDFLDKYQLKPLSVHN